MFKRISKISQFFLAVLIYASFAGWLFWPHLENFVGPQRVLLILGVISAAGVFILARRYVNSFVARFFAGIIYGFGTFACAFYTGFHPFAFCIYAALPWIFFPAVFLYELPKINQKLANFFSAVLSLLPFVFVIACFSLAAMPRFRLVPIPVGTAVSAENFTALVNPLSFPIDAFSVGFFHLPIGALTVGFVLFLRTRRSWTAVLFALAVFLSLCQPILNVPPVVWFSFVVLICSIICAEGFEAMVLAGHADANWLLLSATAIIFQAALCSVLYSGANVLISSVLSGICLIAVLLTFFVARAGMAVHYVRMLALYTTALMDVVIVTRNIIDKIF
jgi:hypothetical protein